MWYSSRKAGLSVIALIAIGAIIVGTNAERRVILRGGQDVTTNEGSFVVRISMNSPKGGSECTGSIISPRHILTAGHCIDGFTSAVIYGGTRHRSDRNPIVSNVVQFHLHPQFGTGFGGYDIGVMELATDLDLSGRQTSVPLPTSQVGFNRRGFQFGWSKCGSDNQQTLQKISVGFLEKEACINRGTFDDYPRMLCVDTDAAGTCGGDSGGPILSGGRVIGVHTLGMDSRREPSHAQNVYHYLDWINSIIGQRYT